MKLPDPKNSLSIILDDLTARLERIEAKLGILLEHEIPDQELLDRGYISGEPEKRPKRHKQPWE